VSSPIGGESVYQQTTTEASVAIDSASAPSPNMPINSSDHAAMMSRSSSEEGLTTNGHSNGEQVEADSSTESLDDRSSLTESQVQQLQKAYHSGQNNDSAYVQELAKRMKLPETKIKAWFSLHGNGRNGNWGTSPPQTQLKKSGNFSPPHTQSAALQPDLLKTHYSAQASVAYCNPITSSNYASYMTHVPPQSSSYTTFASPDLHALPAAATSWMPYSQFAYPGYLASKRSVQGASN
jgi:hypothetical protein